MAWLFNIAYLLLLAALSPWLVWQSWRTGKYRRGWRQKLLGDVPRLQGDRFRVWIHAVSVGEVNLLAPILKRLAEEHPDWECIISTTTDTGFELARTKYAGHTVFYCPLDFSWAIRRALRNIRPGLLVLAELELWPNLIRETKKAGAKIAVINARLSERSFRGYARLGGLMRGVLRRIDLVAPQNEDYAERFRQLGIAADRVMTTGSVKFDNAPTERGNLDSVRLQKLAGISIEERVFLAGSTQAPEEELALKVWRKLSPEYPDLRLILVPRHPERFDEVARLLADSGVAWVRRSQLDGSQSESRETQTAAPLPVILVDTVGELGAWWGLTHIAYVGGSMGTRGGQNMIEPAGYAAAVSFGPKTKNFRDVVAMMRHARAAVVVQDATELEQFVRQCLSAPDRAAAMGHRAQRLVVEQQGATARTIAALTALLSPASAKRTSQAA